MSTQPKLFQPITVGDITLQHRIALAPVTRTRNDKDTQAPLVHLVRPYYEQRASTPGTLLITEATAIARQASGFPNAAGIYSQDQIDAWKQVVDGIHAQGSFIFLQLWALGRAANVVALRELGDYPIVGASSIPISTETVVPHALTKTEIQEYIQLYVQAAKNAVFGAGFDGVEIHGAHGFLVDQFLQDITNDRTDEYGGSIENRSRFALEVVDAVAEAVGPRRTGIRFSPWAQVHEMGMKDPVPQFSHVVTEIKRRQPDFAYIHVVEPRVNGMEDVETVLATKSNDFIRDIWSPKPLISAGGYVRESALKRAEGDIIASGRWFISNPDLPVKSQRDIPWTKYDRKTFYVSGRVTEGWDKGYLDYPFAKLSCRVYRTFLGCIIDVVL
ncbi:FMN-linked oxidoreductase [Pluteus cervinus]|uniref:FMN-linked oxidoreductase n=1 Tax=Pluteus cervinus TaxID=181527 RepID=A0ACD3B417_9AGAR|nr:FMN-linked oxidoreductase [Pluteus cervinus]